MLLGRKISTCDCRAFFVLWKSRDTFISYTLREWWRHRRRPKSLLRRCCVTLVRLQVFHHADVRHLVEDPENESIDVRVVYVCGGRRGTVGF